MRIPQAPRIYQRCGGLFSIMSGLGYKAALLFIKTIPQAALDFGKSVISDIVSGDGTLNTFLRNRGQQALTGVGC